MKNHKQSILRFLTAENRYGGYCIPIGAIHRPAARIVLRGRVHEPKTIDYILEHCGTGDILAAGAFFGDFLPALSGHAAPSARVWSFEPNDENFRCAQITCLINDLKNVFLFNAGLGETEKEAYLDCVNKQGHSRGGRSTIVEAVSDGKTYQKARVVSFDSVLPEGRQVSMIQLDLEGYELAALKGAINTIRRSKPVMILETVPSDPWFADNIRSLGYREVGTLHNRNTIFRVD
jgi:FkbM family methyltransferase